MMKMALPLLVLLLVATVHSMTNNEAMEFVKTYVCPNLKKFEEKLDCLAGHANEEHKDDIKSIFKCFLGDNIKYTEKLCETGNVPDPLMKCATEAKAVALMAQYKIQDVENAWKACNL